MTSLNSVNAAYFDRLFVAKNNTALASPLKAKVLLVDRATMPIISMGYTQSQLLQHDVILTELIDNGAGLSPMPHLNCVVYVKPSRESVAALCAELRRPHYAHYQVFFSNTVSKSDLEKIAAADEHEVVSQVGEVFQDYAVVNDNLFQIHNTDQFPQSNPSPSSNQIVEECLSLSSLLLSLRKCPVVRYDTTSLESKRLASEVLYYINSNSNNNLFDEVNAQSQTPPVLLILDRKWDPITPLVTPWTYQSMIHELVGISRHVVSVGGEQVTLSETQDSFFAESMYLNYGDLTDRFQKYVDEYKAQTKQSSIENLKTQDLAELKKILTRFPEFKKLSNNILKHLNIISELDKQISAQNLWAVGELQQTIVCELENHQTIRSRLMDLISDSQIPTAHKVKLLLLYTSKHPTQQADLKALVGKLNDPITTSPAPTQSQLSLITNFHKHFKAAKQQQDLVSPDNSNNLGQLFNKNRIKISQLFNSNNRGPAHTDNIYMQYIPKLHQILAGLTQEQQPQQPQGIRLEGVATLVPDAVSRQYGDVSRLTPREVIVYFKGGVTYEEARMVHDLAKVNPSTRYIVGGDRILNSEQWVERMCDEVNNVSEPDAGARRAQLREIL